MAAYSGKLRIRSFESDEVDSCFRFERLALMQDRVQVCRGCMPDQSVGLGVEQSCASNREITVLLTAAVDPARAWWSVSSCKCCCN
jgi:hypothetical protein